jgi:hypothetical protein
MIKSPLSGWMGGKWQLSRQIVPLIPEHECYVELFAGAAWALFSAFTLLPVTCRYSCTTGDHPQARELLILNFAPSAH